MVGDSEGRDSKVSDPGKGCVARCTMTFGAKLMTLQNDGVRVLARLHCTPIPNPGRCAEVSCEIRAAGGNKTRIVICRGFGAFPESERVGGGLNNDFSEQQGGADVYGKQVCEGE